MSRRRGTTVTELVVAFVLLALLMAVAKVGVDAVSRRSQSTAATASVRLVLEAQQSFAQVYGTYTPYPDDISLPTADVEMVARPSLLPSEISVAVGSAGTLALAFETADGECRGLTVSALGSGAVESTAVFTAGVLCDARAILPSPESPVPSVSAAW